MYGITKPGCRQTFCMDSSSSLDTTSLLYLQLRHYNRIMRAFTAFLLFHTSAPPAWPEEGWLVCVSCVKGNCCRLLMRAVSAIFKLVRGIIFIFKKQRYNFHFYPVMHCKKNNNKVKKRAPTSLTSWLLNILLHEYIWVYLFLILKLVLV